MNMNVEAEIAEVKQKISAIEFLIGGIGDSNNPWINVYQEYARGELITEKNNLQTEKNNLQTEKNLLLQQQLPTQSQTGNGFSLIVSFVFYHLMAHTIQYEAVLICFSLIKYHYEIYLSLLSFSVLFLCLF